MPKPYWPEISEIHEEIRLSMFDEIYKIVSDNRKESGQIKAVLKYIDKNYETADPLSDREKKCIARQKETLNQTLKSKIKAGIEKGMKELEKNKK